MTVINVGMQASLNNFDGASRVNSLNVSTVPKGRMTIPNEIDAADDKAKIDNTSKDLNLEGIDFFENIHVSRTGQEKAGIPRLIKVTLATVDNRNMVLDNTEVSNVVPELWCKICISKDLHPVYSKQNKRLRDKKTELKNKAANKDENIRIVKGKLMMDNEVI